MNICKKLWLLAAIMMACVSVTSASLADDAETWVSSISEDTSTRTVELCTYAYEQASEIGTLIDGGFAPFYLTETEEFDTLKAIDLTNPKYVDVFVCDADKFDPYYLFTKNGMTVSDDVAKAVKSKLYTLPLYRLRQSTGTWRDLNELLQIDYAAEFPELDGLAYVFQAYGDDYRAGKPFLVTAILTVDYPLAITHSEFVAPGALALMPSYISECVDSSKLEVESFTLVDE